MIGCAGDIDQREGFPSEASGQAAEREVARASFARECEGDGREIVALFLYAPVYAVVR